MSGSVGNRGHASDRGTAVGLTSYSLRRVWVFASTFTKRPPPSISRPLRSRRARSTDSAPMNVQKPNGLGLLEVGSVTLSHLATVPQSCRHAVDECEAEWLRRGSAALPRGAGERSHREPIREFYLQKSTNTTRSVEEYSP